MTYMHHSDREQERFNFQLRWIFKVFGIILFKVIPFVILYLPLMAAGYFLSSKFVPFTAPAHTQLIGATISSIVIFELVFLIKGMLVSFFTRKKIVWVFLWMLLAAFTCVLSPWLSYKLLHGLLHDNYVLVILIALVTIFVYRYYAPLTDRAPVEGLAAYKLGFAIAQKF